MHVEPFTVPVPGVTDPTVTPRGRHFRFSNTGPRILVTAGLHGNEVNGVAACWYLAERLADERLSGTVSVIPCVNPLAVAGKTRRVPGEDTDPNRFFPGNPTGYFSERLAVALVGLLAGYDFLIDVHTTGLCVPHLLLDRTSDANLARRTLHWAAASGLPPVAEMPAELAEAQGIGHCWSAAALERGVPAVTVELPGFLTLYPGQARCGTDAVLALTRAAGRVPTTDPAPPLVRTELHGSTAGLFEATRAPGMRVRAGERLGVVRSFNGEPAEEVRAPADGVLLVLQTGSAVTPGAWLATLGVPA